MTAIGAPLDRVDGPLKVCGQAHYTGDLALPGMAHAVLVTRGDLGFRAEPAMND